MSDVMDHGDIVAARYKFGLTDVTFRVVDCDVTHLLKQCTVDHIGGEPNYGTITWLVDERQLIDLRAENERLRKALAGDENDLERLLDKYASDCQEFFDQAEGMRTRLDAITAIVDEQAEDEGLWCPAATATEAYLQQGLRRLHAAVEGER